MSKYGVGRLASGRGTRQTVTSDAFLGKGKAICNARNEREMLEGWGGRLLVRSRIG